jgi:antitoxin MazE
MHATIQKWGNSLALKIPKELGQQAGFKRGDSVSLAVEKGCLIIRPARQHKYTLKELVSKVTPQNRHPETDWGRSVGKEIW